MGLLDRTIKNSVNRAVNRAVGNAVERKVTEVATGAIDRAADKVVPPPPPPSYPQQGQPQYQQPTQPNPAAAQWGAAFAGLAGGMQSFANEAARNMKICPHCNQGAPAANKFCPNCGGTLPEATVAQGAACTGCGMQNSVGTKFCAGCGAKLPGAIAEENAARSRDAATMAKWEQLLPQYPHWNMGGHSLELEDGGIDDKGYPYYSFSVRGTNSAALAGYCQQLKQWGFRPAGQYPSEQQLYKRVNGLVYNFSADDAFAGGAGNMSVWFCIREPHGGFDYVKPEPKKATSWRDKLGF